MFTQLNPPLPVLVTDKGAGLAFAVIDYGVEHNLIWVTALDGSGAVVPVLGPFGSSTGLVNKYSGNATVAFIPRSGTKYRAMHTKGQQKIQQK